MMMFVNYTRRRYETLQLAATGAYRVTQSAGSWAKRRVLRVLKDSNDRSLEPSAAANGEAQAVLDLLRGGALSAPTSEREPVTLTHVGHELLATWTERWRRQRRRDERRERV
jgi:hypothetical protein